MKRKPSVKRVVQENPEWTKATFAKARPAREVLPAILGERTAKEL